MLTLVIGVGIGFMAGIALVVWQLAVVAKLKKLVEELREGQANQAALLASPQQFSAVGQPEPAEDRIIEAIRALSEKLAPTPKPADPFEMIARRIHSVEEDLLATSHATANNAKSIEHHSDRLAAHGAEHSRLNKMVSDMESDMFDEFDKLDKKIDALASRADKTFGQFGAAIDMFAKKLVAGAKKEAAPAAE